MHRLRKKNPPQPFLLEMYLLISLNLSLSSRQYPVHNPEPSVPPSGLSGPHSFSMEKEKE